MAISNAAGLFSQFKLITSIGKMSQKTNLLLQCFISVPEQEKNI